MRLTASANGGPIRRTASQIIPTLVQAMRSADGAAHVAEGTRGRHAGSLRLFQGPSANAPCIIDRVSLSWAGGMPERILVASRWLLPGTASNMEVALV